MTCPTKARKKMNEHKKFDEGLEQLIMSKPKETMTA